MSKILEIKASEWKREDLPGYHVRYTLPDDATVSLDGATDAPTPSKVGNVAPAADSSASGNAAAGALLGGGSGGYAGGGVGGAAPETAQTMNVQDIAFVPGGVTHIPYPQGNQKRYRITGVVPGPGCFEFTVGAGKSGNGRFSLTGAEIDACPIVRAVYATERGVFVGPSILETYGQRNHFSEAFVVGKPGGGGYGPELPTDKPTDVNVEFAAGVPGNITCEIAAHDR